MYLFIYSFSHNWTTLENLEKYFGMLAGCLTYTFGLDQRSCHKISDWTKAKALKIFIVLHAKLLGALDCENRVQVLCCANCTSSALISIMMQVQFPLAVTL